MGASWFCGIANLPCNSNLQSLVMLEIGVQQQCELLVQSYIFSTKREQSFCWCFWWVQRCILPILSLSLSLWTYSMAVTRSEFYLMRTSATQWNKRNYTTIPKSLWTRHCGINCWCQRAFHWGKIGYSTFVFRDFSKSIRCFIIEFW